MNEVQYMYLYFDHRARQISLKNIFRQRKDFQTMRDRLVVKVMMWDPT